jgi:hypothetical protein
MGDALVIAASTHPVVTQIDLVIGVVMSVATFAAVVGVLCDDSRSMVLAIVCFALAAVLRLA